MLFNRKLLSAVAIITATITLGLASVSTFALTPSKPAKVIALESRQQKEDLAIAKLEKYMTRENDGTLTLSAPKKVINSIDKDIYKSLVGGLKITNDLIKTGDFVSDINFKITSKVPNEGVTLSSNNVARAAAVNTGNRVGVESYWWGFNLYYSSTMCNQITNSYNQAVATATLVIARYTNTSWSRAMASAAILPIALVANVMGYYNSAGRGVKVRFTGYIPPIVTGIWSQ